MIRQSLSRLRSVRKMGILLILTEQETNSFVSLWALVSEMGLDPTIPNSISDGIRRGFLSFPAEEQSGE